MTNLILTAFLAVGLIVVFYRFAVRPLLRFAFFERIEGYEKQLERMVACGTLCRTDFTYRFLKHRFQAKDHLSHIGISGFLHFMICRDPNEKSPEETQRFLAESGPELKDLHYAFCRDFLRWMVLNSPSYSVPGFFVIGTLMLYRRMNEEKVMNEAFNFADIESNCCAS